MPIQTGFLQSKLGRRVFFLFLSCSILPIGILAFLVFQQVTDQLWQESGSRLRWTSKSTSMEAMGRLSLINSELKLTAEKVKRNSGELGEDVEEIQAAGLTEVRLLQGSSGFFVDEWPSDSRQLEFLQSGRSLLVQNPDNFLVLLLAVDPDDLGQGILLGKIDLRNLFGVDETNQIVGMDFILLNSSGMALMTSLGVTGEELNNLKSQIKSNENQAFEWRDSQASFHANAWTLPLGYLFMETGWTLVLLAPMEEVLGPVRNFKMTFISLLFGTLLLVALVSSIQIRRSLDPVQKLRRGTELLAGGQFASVVSIDSGDEFEELAHSFNQMAGQLDQQFKALSTMGEIDRAVLSAMKVNEIIETSLKLLPGLSRCQQVTVSLFDEPKNELTRYRIDPENSLVSQKLHLSPQDLTILRSTKHHLRLEANRREGDLFLGTHRDSSNQLVFFPLFIEERLAGALEFLTSEASWPSETLNQLRQVADQLAIALSNASLLQQLNDLHLGTLAALARSVDAKSPWTAGHSERVASMSLRIGRHLGLTEDVLERIQRGALLHDIGKIGVPAKILDKPAKLTEQEWEKIRQHTVIGVRILEPIKAFRDILPIVRHHHERLDGGGYPDGISGDQISMEVRVVTVADVFDALTSDRPYRSGLGLEASVKIIQSAEGGQFDSEVVAAFLQAIRSERDGIDFCEESLEVLPLRGPDPRAQVLEFGEPYV